ncbi:MAG: glycosyltransferase family 2 protein [Simkaniaceae bacterium]|nr:glycosyltransferase family 2 protein [Simkaniaceae bacterium]
MLSVTILTKNSAKTLDLVLQSVKFFPEILILDTGSTDSTFEIAKNYKNVKVHKTPFIGFGPLHNQMAKLATYDWILSLDSDEVLTEPLALEIQNLELDPNKVYSISFNNYFNGKHIKWCGWYPDRHVRLYNKQMTNFTNDHVHEGIILKNLEEIKLKNPINHYSYTSISDFLRKMENYSSLFATQNYQTKNSSMSKALFRGLFAFFKCYFLKRGFLGGKEGLIISIYNAQTTYYKYLKLLEQKQKCS